MTHTEIELFINLLSHKTLSEAAAKVGVSQPRASQMLQKLERELSCELFERSHVGLEPTSAAHAFRPFAETMLSAWTDGVRAARESCEGVQGTLHVGVSHTTSAFTVPFIMRQFHRAYPNVRLTLTKSLPPQLLSGLETELLDLCLCFKPPRTAPYLWESLFLADLVGIYAPSFEADIHPDLGKFARLPLVLPSRHCSSRLLLDTELQKLGITPSILMEIDDSASLASMVRHGVAVSIVPRTMVKASGQLKMTSLRHPQVFAEAGMMLKRNPSKASTAFIELIRQEIDLRRVANAESHAGDTGDFLQDQ